MPPPLKAIEKQSTIYSRQAFWRLEQVPSLQILTHFGVVGFGIAVEVSAENGKIFQVTIYPSM